MTKENIAQVAHEVNKTFCESIGDFSQPSWNDAPEWQKSSAINGVQFHLDNPNASPCNTAKNSMSKDEFKNHIIKIYNHLCQKQEDTQMEN